MARRWFVSGVLLIWLAGPPAAMAHSGAPYPVLLEQVVGPYVVSSLADPDVGVGTFIVLIKLTDDRPAPEGTTVILWAVPTDGHSPETGYTARRQQTGDGERFVAGVAFDVQGPWQVRLVLDGPAGYGEITFPVRVTPPGVLGLGTLLCLLPFVALGALWLVSARRQRAAQVTQGD